MMRTEKSMREWALARYAGGDDELMRELQHGGRYPRLCDCGELGCEGYAMWPAHDTALMDNVRFDRDEPFFPDVGYGGAPVTPVPSSGPAPSRSDSADHAPTRQA